MQASCRVLPGESRRYGHTPPTGSLAVLWEVVGLEELEAAERRHQG